MIAPPPAPYLAPHMPLEITELTMRDYDEALALWRRSQGVSLRGADSRGAIERYLRRNPGIGRALAERCLAALPPLGIEKCHLFVVSDNDGARGFWRHAGWEERADVRLMSRTLSAPPNA